MATMQETKRRMSSITSTKKITNAMQLVATAKLRRARIRFDESKSYFNEVEASVQNILSNTKNIDHRYINERPVKKSLYIVVTSDIGLCGGYNANVYKKIKEANGNYELITLGIKGDSHFKYVDADVLDSFPGITSDPRYKDAIDITQQALARYEQGEIDEIFLIHTEFVNSVTFTPKVTKLLPVSANETESKVTEIEYEPSPEVMLDFLVPKYIEALIYGGMIESLVSEYASRRMAMENATDNAQELLDLLELEYNRARQAAITQEISEIVAGAGAL